MGGEYKLKIKFQNSLIQHVSLLSLKLVYILRIVYIVVFSCEDVAMFSSFKDLMDWKIRF